MSAQNSARNPIRIVGGRPGEYPLKLEIIPKRLIVTVYHHQLTGRGSYIPCWTFVTSGMAAAGQSEFVMTIRRREQEDPAKFPKQPLQLFTMLFKQLAQKKRFDFGDVLKFGSTGMLGFSGAGFTFTQLNDSQVPISESHLGVYLLKNMECVVAQQMGLTRVLSRLGYETNYYPFNFWNDLDRSEAPLQSVFEQSELRNLNPHRIKHASANLYYGETLLLVLPVANQPAFSALVNGNEQIDSSFTLLTQFYNYHQGILVWLPEKNLIEMNMPVETDGELIAGNFIQFQRGEQTGATMLEDGFRMVFDEQTWPVFARAVAGKQNISIQPSADDMPFRLVWKRAGPPERLTEADLVDDAGFTADYAQTGRGWLQKLKRFFRRR